MYDAKSYAFLHCIEHLSEAGRPDALFHALERTHFLADQAAHLGSFRQGRADLLSFALPWAIRCKDWNGFLRFALRALNLGRMSRSLASYEVLGALVSSGWMQLALDVAAQQPEGAERIRARAVIAGRVAEGAERRSLLASIGEDLQNLPRPEGEDGATELTEILASVAREIAPRDWPGGPGMLVPLQSWPDLADGVWIAAAEGCLRRSGLGDDELWEALRRVQEPEHLRALLPFPLATAPGDFEPENLKERLPDLPPDLLWPTCFALLGRQARNDPEHAVRSFETMVRDESIPWSGELVETGEDLFRSMKAEHIRHISEAVSDDISRAALWTLCLEGDGDQDTARTAVESILGLPPGPEQVHWSLRYLRADRISPVDHIRRHTEAARLFFLEHGYAAPPRDLALYLDLIAEMLPERCADELQNVTGNLGSLDALEELVGAVGAAPVLAELHERAETMAGIAAPGERFQKVHAAGNVLVSVAARLCVDRQDLLYLKSTEKRLPPVRRDRLRTVVAERLHRAGQLHLAEEAVSRMESTEARLAILLDLWPRKAESVLREPASLYASFASVKNVEDERLGLAALFASPIHPGDAELDLQQMSPGPVAAAAVFRIARHSLTFQEAAPGSRRDGLEVLHFIEKALQAGSLPRSPGWLPEIVELAARVEDNRLLRELQAACPELFSRSWDEEGRDIFEDLLFRLRSTLPPSDLRLALRILLDSLNQLPDESRQDRLLGALPLLCAVSHQLPKGLTWVAESPLRHAARRALRETSDGSEAAIVARLCAADRDELREATEFLLGEARIVPVAFHTLALLLSPTDPGTAVALMKRSPSGQGRDAAALRLIRHRWLPAPLARELLANLERPEASRMARLVLETNDNLWLQALTEPGEGRGLDPSDPQASPLLQKLWSIAPQRSRPPLAEAAITALATAPEAGEQAIRLWLHAHLPPRLGTAQPERRQQSTETAASVREALALSAPGIVVPPAPPPEPAELAEMASEVLRWRQAGYEAVLWFLKKYRTWTALNGFLAVTALFLVGDFELNLPDPAAWESPLRPLEWLFLLTGWFFHVLDWSHTNPMWLAALAVYPVNAILIHRLLDGVTPRQDLRFGILGARFLAGGLPLLGLAVIPVWQSLSQARPSWAFRKRRTRILEEAGKEISVTMPLVRGIGSGLHRLTESPRFLLLWLWPVNLIAVRLGTSRLSAEDLLSPEGRLAVTLLLHSLGFAATASWLIFAPHRRETLSGKDRFAPWVIACTWFLPFPLPMLGMQAFAPPELRRQAAGALSVATEGAGPPPEWALLLKRLREHARTLSWRRRPWGLELPPRAGLAQQRFLSLCRTKTFLLLFDGMFLAIVSGILARQAGFRLALPVLLLLAALVIAVLAAGNIGLMIRRIYLLRRLVRTGELDDSDDPHPYGRALTTVSGALAAGIALGCAVVADNPFLFAVALATLGFAGLVLGFPPEHKTGSVGPAPGQFVRRLLARSLLFALLGLLGLMALGGGNRADAIMSWFTATSLRSPLLALTLCLLRHPRLLHPFRLRDLFSSRLPIRARLALSLLLLTLAVPLGGLAIPLWIWVRERQWPVWERALEPPANG